MTGQTFDMVITVCDQAAGEACSIFPGNPRKIHWSIPDPGRVIGTDDEINTAFDHTFSLLKTKIQDFLS